MIPETYSLKELTAKVARGEELTYTEARFVKQRYRQLREQCESVLGACRQDEVPAISLRNALASLEAKKISSSDYVLEVFDIQGEIFGSSHGKKHGAAKAAPADGSVSDQRSHYRQRRLTRLRQTVAYRMAMAALFFSHTRYVGKIKHLPNLAQELLFQMDHLDVSVSAHSRALQRLDSEKATEPGRN